VSTLTRQEYELTRADALIDKGYAVDEADAQPMVDAEYPKATDQAIEELRVRGLDTSPWLVERYIRLGVVKPPKVGGTRIWMKCTIDALADAMELGGHLTPAAIYRQELGLSWQEEQAIRKTLAAQREARDAQ